MCSVQPAVSKCHRHPRKAAALKVSISDVLAAVESLYHDRLRPYGRILLKRLGERLAVDLSPAVTVTTVRVNGKEGGEIVPRIDTAHLRKSCERCRQLRVEAEEGGEYSVFLVGWPANFVDAQKEYDPFPSALWAAMSAFFAEGGAGAYLELPGGRYACARTLQTAGLPFMSGYVLGEICHLVQLAISHKKILGYLDGRIVPHFRSENVVKQQSADRLQPAWPLKKDDLPVADRRQVRTCLQAILSSPQCAERGGVPLPNIKRIFRSDYQLQLMETIFGHSRLHDLLLDPAFSDLCEVRLQGTTHMVSLAQHCATLEEHDEEVVELEQGASWEPSIARTFIHLKTAPTATRRQRSLPRSWKANIHEVHSPFSFASDASSDIADSSPSRPTKYAFSDAETLALSVDSDDEETSLVGSYSKVTSWASEVSSVDALDLEKLSDASPASFRTPSPSPRHACAVTQQSPCFFGSLDLGRIPSVSRTPSPSPRYSPARRCSPPCSPAPCGALVEKISLFSALSMPQEPVLGSGFSQVFDASPMCSLPRQACQGAPMPR